MSLAAFAIAEVAIAEPVGAALGRRPPAKRTIVPKPDVRQTPEPR